MDTFDLVNQGCAASGRREQLTSDICCKNTHISHSHIALTHCTHIALGGNNHTILQADKDLLQAEKASLQTEIAPMRRGQDQRVHKIYQNLPEPTRTGLGGRQSRFTLSTVGRPVSQPARSGCAPEYRAGPWYGLINGKTQAKIYMPEKSSGGGRGVAKQSLTGHPVVWG